MNPKPDCKQDCRFSYGISSTTCMYFHPVYDKQGNNLNPDANITTRSLKCFTCNECWISRTRLGVTEFTKIEEKP